MIVIQFKKNIFRSTVRVVRSERAGVGKTLYVRRQDECLQSQVRRCPPRLITERVTIPLQEKTINMQTVTQRLLEHTQNPDVNTARIFHIDISHEACLHLLFSCYIYFIYLIYFLLGFLRHL